MTAIPSEEIANVLGAYELWPTDPTGEWSVDPTGEWLYNPKAQMAYNAASDVLYTAQTTTTNQIEWICLSMPREDLEGSGSKGEAAEERPLSTTEAIVQESEQNVGIYEKSSEEGEVEEEEDSNDILVDLETSLLAGTASMKSTAKHKNVCEDKFVTILNLPIHLFSLDSTLCYYFAIFDGHAGVDCAEYAQNHLHNNILSVYSQSTGKVKRKREDVNQGSRKREKYSPDLETLIYSCKKSFEMTDKNYIHISKQKGFTDGSTACVVLLYGPDEDGILRVVSAHAGDTRAILCRDNTALRLTEDHKPDRPDERERILQAGGEVRRMSGIWRVVPHSKELGASLSLSVSRGFGDASLKHPFSLLSSEPEVNVYNINFDTDQFLVLGSDGIFDVLSDQDVIDIILQNLQLHPGEAADAVVKAADERGSLDDKTCSVVYFRWHPSFCSDVSDGADVRDTQTADISTTVTASQPLDELCSIDYRGDKDCLKETTDCLKETTDCLKETTDCLKETTDCLKETAASGDDPIVSQPFNRKAAENAIKGMKATQNMGVKREQSKESTDNEGDDENIDIFASTEKE